MYAITGNAPLSIATSLCSHLPDAIEFGMGKFIFPKHRGISHNPLLWLAVLALSWLFAYHPMIEQAAWLLKSFHFAPWWVLLPAIGAFFHLAEDALSISGIPLWNGQRLAAGLYRTGTFREFLVVLVFAAGAMLRGVFDPGS